MVKICKNQQHLSSYNTVKECSLNFPNVSRENFYPFQQKKIIEIRIFCIREECF